MSESNQNNRNLLGLLPPDSHTARRLEHATATHLHQTTKRVFIGPIPEGWLNSHRKQWYKKYAGPRASRAPTFTAQTTNNTANPAPIATVTNSGSGDGGGTSQAHARPAPPRSSIGSTNLDVGVTGDDGPASTTSLLRGAASQRVSSIDGTAAVPTAATEEEEQGQRLGETEPTIDSILNPSPGTSRIDRATNRLPVAKVRFTEASKLQLRARASRLAAKGSFRSSKVKDGEMMKVDKMLIRTDVTQQSLQEDYDEKISQGVETTSIDKWREFMVVCRAHTEGDANAVLQFYQTRVINVSESDKVRKKPKVEILLGNTSSKVSLYSALDKTLCIWTREKSRTTIYYLRAASTASAVEWYTFLRGVLGHRRAQTLQVNIPDLSVSLRLDNPFDAIETSQTLADAAEGDDDALAKAVNDEKGAAGAIVNRCIKMLEKSSEWSDVLTAWMENERMGLAWKRYDRLEWIYGQVEQRMYGTIAMARTHDLELRPKDHYPDHTKQKDGSDLHEPPPVEGFLIRLTSQKGREQTLGRMMFKRLYFTSHNQYLFFVRPANAVPPPPLKMPTLHHGPAIPSTKDISAQVPLVWEVDPYPIEGKNVAWLDGQGIMTAKEVEEYDKEAATEAERNINIVLSSDGFMDLSGVRSVRKYAKGASAVDENIDGNIDEDGDDVDFHVEVSDTLQNDGATKELDEDRVLELVLKNGLVVRLQAFNKSTRDEWMKRLRQLSKYWTERVRADMDLYKQTRDQNLRELGIDERAEAVVGQFAYKWEVGKSFASPSLYNMCGIAGCRTVHISGTLFRKPRKHTTFGRCHVILSHGHLLIFQDTLRKRTGKKLVHIHHERISSISLEGCYLYSGLLTENDLLYQNQTFDSNTPGHHALPRIYLEDSWTSTDEDAMTTFVIWHAKSNSWFKSSSTVDDVAKQNQQAGGQGRVKTKLTRVSQLGATGRSVVFKARSRAERDHWVLAIQVEIERLASQREEVRLVDD